MIIKVVTFKEQFQWTASTITTISNSSWLQNLQHHIHSQYKRCYFSPLNHIMLIVWYVSTTGDISVLSHRRFYITRSWLWHVTRAWLTQRMPFPHDFNGECLFVTTHTDQKDCVHCSIFLVHNKLVVFIGIFWIFFIHRINIFRLYRKKGWHRGVIVITGSKIIGQIGVIGVKESLIHSVIVGCVKDVDQ